MERVPLHVPCEIRLAPSALARLDRSEEAVTRYVRLTESVSADEIVFVHPLDLEPGRTVEISLVLPDDSAGRLQASAVLSSARTSDERDDGTVRVASLRAVGGWPAERTRIARYAERRRLVVEGPVRE